MDLMESPICPIYLLSVPCGTWICLSMREEGNPSVMENSKKSRGQIRQLRKGAKEKAHPNQHYVREQSGKQEKTLRRRQIG